MSIGRQNLSGLIEKIISASPGSREEGAENVCDWSGSFDELEARMVVRVLSLISTIENVEIARETQLHAILEIFDSSVMNIHDVAPVFEIDQEDLDPSERLYLEELREYLT